MRLKLQSLMAWLSQHHFQKEAEEVEELQYQEPWHEEVVQELGGEPISESDYLQQFQAQPEEIRDPEDSLPGEGKIIQDILNQEHFQTPIRGGSEQGSQEIFIGSGWAGQVYRGVYQGKPAAAKVILESFEGDDQEVEAWQKILQVSKSFPPELKKHIPKIYLAKHGTLKRSGEDYPYAIVIMEELFPLDPEMKKFLDQTKDEEEDQHHLDQKWDQYFQEASKDPELLNQIAKQMAANLSDLTRQIWDPNQIFRALYRSKLPIHNQDIVYDVLDELEPKIKQLPGRLSALVPQNLSRSLVQFIVRTIPPLNSQTDQPNSPWHQMPETKQLYQTLQELKQAGVSWDDLHANNIMQDREGNLKFIDAGAFHLR